MKMTRLGALLLVGTLSAVGRTVHANIMTLTGTVSDSMCGTKHQVADATACTKDCVKKGSDYALVIKDRVYTLKADATEKADFDKLAGHVAEVMGNVDGMTVAVRSVKMGVMEK